MSTFIGSVLLFVVAGLVIGQALSLIPSYMFAVVTAIVLAVLCLGVAMINIRLFIYGYRAISLLDFLPTLAVEIVTLWLSARFGFKHGNKLYVGRLIRRRKRR